MNCRFALGSKAIASPIDIESSRLTRGPFVRFGKPSIRWLSRGSGNCRGRIDIEIVETMGTMVEPTLSTAGLISDADLVPYWPLIVLVEGDSQEDARQSPTLTLQQPS